MWLLAAHFFNTRLEDASILVALESDSEHAF